MAKAQIAKQPSERFFIGVDVSDEIVEGDSLLINSCVVKEFKVDSEGLYVLSDPFEILDVPTLRVAVGNILEVAVKDGVHGEKFKISFQAGTVNSDVYEGDIFVTIKEL